MSSSATSTNFSVNGPKRTKKTTTITYNNLSGQGWVEDTKVEVIEECDEPVAPYPYYNPYHLDQQPPTLRPGPVPMPYIVATHGQVQSVLNRVV